MARSKDLLKGKTVCRSREAGEGCSHKLGEDVLSASVITPRDCFEPVWREAPGTQ